MKRPLLVVGISYAGATWASFFLGGALVLSVLSAVAGLVLLLLRERNGRMAAAVLLSAAVAFAAWEAYHARAIAPLRAAVGRDVTVQGVVTAVDARRLPTYALTVRASFPADNLPDTLLRLRGWGELGFEPGDGIHATVRMEELMGSHAFYNSRGVFMSARLLEYRHFDELTFWHRGERFFLQRRAQAVENVRHHSSPLNANMVAGMTLGHLDEMAPELATALSRAGVIHMVVVSGMHLSILVGLIAELLRRLRAGQRASALAGMGAALGFAFLVGLSPSIMRALIMMLVYLGAGMFSRRSDSLNSLGFALLLICIAAPHWMLDRGLWMSFCATAGIIVWSGPMIERIKRRYAGESLPVRLAANTFLGAGAVTLSAYVFCLPVMVTTVGWLSLISPVVNVLVAPLAAPTLVFGLIGAATTARWATPFAVIADICAGLIADISLSASALPFAVLRLSEFWLLIWLLFSGGAAVYLVRRRAQWRLWRYALALAAVVFAVGSVTFAAAQRGTIEVAAIEGVSPIVLTREGSAVVVGTPELFEINRLVRYLSYRGIERLDAVIAYDSGPQMTSALIRLVRDYQVGLIIGPDDDYILGQMARALPGVSVMSGGSAAINVLGGAYIRPSPNGREIEIQVGRTSIVKSGEEYAIMSTEGRRHYMDAQHLAPAGQPAQMRNYSTSYGYAIIGREHDPHAQRLASAGQTGQVRIWQGGVMVWPRDAPPVFEPLGALLFGERRLVLSV